MALRSKRRDDTEGGSEETIGMAWRTLPVAHRRLLESIGASQRRVVDEPLGVAVDAFRRSAGYAGLSRSEIDDLNRALGVWLQELKIVLITNRHPKLDGLDAATCEEFLARVAWHEWGHALSIVRCTSDDVASGRRLLKLMPGGVQKRIREAGYRAGEYTYEVVAETYALLMLRRLKGESGQPSWLHDEIYDLLKRVTEWSD